ncbi:MAG: hypothetical protein ACE15D_10100 [Candidatus Eisenbacteria bacterium]|nr:hypothetical protein [Candidatus Eisenbacteria bacterium]
MLILSLAFLVPLLGACNKNRNDQENGAAARDTLEAPSQAANESTTPGEAAPPVATPPSGTRTSHPRERAPRTEDRTTGGERTSEYTTRTFTVPAGTGIVASLQQNLSTENDREGSSFSAVTRESISENGVVLVPAGSTVRGVVTRSQRAPKVGGRAAMNLDFREFVTPDGRSFPIDATTLKLQGEPGVRSDLEKVIGGAVGGGIIGGVLGGKKGAAKGAAGGAAAGGIWAVTTRGKDIVLEQGTDVQVTLASSLSVPIRMRTDQLP